MRVAAFGSLRGFVGVFACFVTKAATTSVSEDRPADQFDNLRDDCVSEGSQSVHPIGNPISHSTHVGFSFPPIIHATSERVVL